MYPLRFISCSTMLVLMTSFTAGKMALMQLPLNVVNAYDDSMDIEWGYHGNVTYYSLLIFPSTNGHNLMDMKTYTNEATISNLKAGVTYKVFVIEHRGNCSYRNTDHDKINNVFNSAWRLTQQLPVKMPRQKITGFVYKLSYITSTKQFMITLTWNQVPDVDLYRVRYRRKSDCSPDQKEILTSDSSITMLLLLDENEAEVNASEIVYLFTLRVLSYKTEAGKKFVYPKADSLHVKLDASLLTWVKERQLNDAHRSHQTYNIALVIGLSVTGLCILFLIGWFYREHRKGNINAKAIKNILRSVSERQRTNHSESNTNVSTVVTLTSPVEPTLATTAPPVTSASLQRQQTPNERNDGRIKKPPGENVYDFC